MSFELNLAVLIIAGIVNGSFVIPTYYIKYASHDRIWFYHTIVGVLIIPWIVLWLFLPVPVTHYTNITINEYAMLLIGGLMFGVGQISFASAIAKIGIAISFVVNIGLGLIIGSLYVLIYRGLLFSLPGLFTILAVILIIASLINFYLTDNASVKQSLHYKASWLGLIFTGITSGIQNIVFITLLTHYPPNLSMNSFWIWPPFLSASAIAMLVGFNYRAKKQRDHLTYQSVTRFFVSPRNTIAIIIMGLFFAGSLAIYGKAMETLSHKQHIVGWPAFMLAIILTTQCWGVIYKQQKSIKVVGLLMLIVAIFLLAIET